MTIPRLVLPAVLLLGLACGGGGTTTTPPPVAPPPVAPATPTPTPPAAPVTPAPVEPAAPVPPAAPAAKTFDQAAFTCCGSERAGYVLREYLDVQRRLVAGDPNRINGQLTALGGAARSAIKMGGYPADQNAVLERIAATADAMLSKNLDDKRKEFKTLSVDVIAFLRQHPGGSTRIAEAWCPMAEGGWLQTESTISNPYYGSAMLTCGNFK